MHAPLALLMTAILCSLSYLLIDGLLTGSVWVKGALNGRWSLSEWAHKRSRIDDPVSYWGFMSFYTLALCWLAYLKFSAPAY